MHEEAMTPTQQRTEEGEKVCPECARTFHNEFRMDPNDSAPFVMRNLPSPDDFPAHIQLTKRKFIDFRNSHAELGEFAAMVCGVDLKTFCLLDMLKFIHKRGAKVTALELELERAKEALKEAEADLCGYASEPIANDPRGGDLGWIRQSQAEETIRVLALVRAALRDLGEGQ